MGPTLKVLFVDCDMNMLQRNISNVAGLCAEVYGLHPDRPHDIIGKPGWSLLQAIRTADIIFVDHISTTPRIKTKLLTLKALCEKRHKRIIVTNRKNLPEGT